MGVDRNDYIVVGCDIKEVDGFYSEHDEDLDDFLDRYYFREKVGEIVFLNDFYSGDYFIIGEILQCTDGYRGKLDYNFYGKEQQIEEAKIRVKAFIKTHLHMDVEPSVIVKTYFS